MEEKSKVQQSIELLQNNHVQLGDDLQSALNEASAPMYKIAVVGRYQTGKTTLINKVFLKEDFLATGEGLCKTSVITRLADGPTKKVSIVKNGLDGNPIVEDVSDPTPEKIEAVTCADSNDARLALSKELVEVEVSWPCASLKNYIVYDTPGIEDPIEELLDSTTYRIIPSVDLVLFVVEAKGLSQEDEAFLKHKLFKYGLKRVMVLVSYNPQKQKLSAAALANVVSEIKGKLASMGREYFPVCVCAYDPTVDGDVLNTPEAIEQRIASFLNENAACARDEKIRYALTYELQKLRNNLVAQASINGKSDEEIKKIEEQVALVGEDLDSRYKRILAEFKADYLSFKDDVNAIAVKSLDRARDVLVGLVEAKEDFASLKNAIPRISGRAKTEFESALVEINTFASNRLQDILSQKQADIAAASKELTLPISLNVKVHTGWAGVLNPRLLIISEYAIMMWLMGGPLGAGIRYATSFIPGLKNILPQSFAKNAVVNSVKQSLQTSCDDVRGLIGDILEETNGYICKAIAQKFVELHKLTCEPYKIAIENASSKKLSESELADINNQITLADNLLEGLK